VFPESVRTVETVVRPRQAAGAEGARSRWGRSVTAPTPAKVWSSPFVLAPSRSSQSGPRAVASPTNPLPL